MLYQDNKEKGFMYLDYRTVDHKATIIVDAYVTKGNVHDSKPYIQRMEYNKDLDVYVEKKTGEVLEYKGLIDKNGYKSYQNNDKTKAVRRHIHEEWNELFRKKSFIKRRERII